MIKNSKQYAYAKDSLKKLELERDEFIKENPASNDIKTKLTTDSYNAIISDLVADIKYFESLSNDGFHCLRNKSLENLGELLIEARIAKNFSQKELAVAVGIDVQQIQRYEASDYESASLYRLQEVAEALEINLTFQDIMILGKNNLRIPANINEDSLKEAEALTQVSGSLLFNL